MSKSKKKSKYGLTSSSKFIDITEGLGKFCTADKEMSLKSHFSSLRSSKRAIEDIRHNIYSDMDSYEQEENTYDEAISELHAYFEQSREVSPEHIKRITKENISHGCNEKLDRVCIENIESPSSKGGDEKSEVSIDTGNPATAPPEAKEEKSQQTESESKGDKSNISAYGLAKLLITLYRFVVIDKVAYFFEKLFGYYIPLIGEYSEIIIRQCVPEEYRHKVTVYMVSEIVWWIKADKSLRVKPKAILERSKYINFENGVLEVETGRFSEHKPELYFTNYVNALYPYSNKVPCSGKLFESFIEHFTNGNDELKMLIQEIGGYIISEIRTVKKAFFFIGESHSGKSTLIELFTKIVGEEFCSSIGFHDLNLQFRLIAIVGKKFNGSAEIGEINTERFDIFKQLTGNDVLMAEDKGKTPVQFRNTAAMAFAGNEFPTSKKIDITNAFFNRIILVPCVAGLAEKDHDRNLMEKIWENERSYVVKWCVEGLKRLIRRNMVFTECKVAQDIKMEQVYEQNSFKAFVDIACTLNSQHEIFSKDLLKAYDFFCHENEMIRLNDSICHKYLKKVLNLTRMRSRDINNQFNRGYIGISVKDEFKVKK